ncbi:MAG: hypothetical protein HYW91_02295 [Candidatus Sungbacteria bacterium]|nr:hypothetical protein [Candidatus Sungbacteria bacterium]
MLIAFASCSTATGKPAARSKELSIITKYSYDYTTTNLFQKPCREKEDAEKAALKDAQKPTKGFFSKATSWLRSKPEEQKAKFNRTVNQCSATNMEEMAEAFMSIQETDETKGILGDTKEQVRKKGFTIFMDQAGKVRRQNTRALYGNDALTAIGMAVSPPPAKNPEEIRTYIEYMAQFYAEEYSEKDIQRVTDRFCINTRDTSEIGDDRTFVILWRGERVFKRNIKGGPINLPKQEKAFLLCPGGFITDAVTGGLNRGIDKIR